MTSVSNRFTAYTDGSCNNLNPQRPGGSAYIIFDHEGKEVKRASKGFIGTSNNRMELLAIISVVNSLPDNSLVIIHSDSKYSINVLSGRWCASENLDQINRYQNLCMSKNIIVKFNWVKGHAGNPHNELCDQMARAEYKNIKKEIPKPKRSIKHKKKRKTERLASTRENQHLAETGRSLL